MAAADILETLLRANLVAALAVALVLCLRRPVRALCGAGAAYGLWAAVPVAALASLLPVRSVLPQIGGLPADMLSFTILPGDAPSAGIDLSVFAVTVWLLGVAASLAVLATRQIRLARATGRLTVESGDPALAHAEHAGVGPAVIGVLAPKIVLPKDFRTRYSPEEQAVILAHETAHLQAGDTRINALIALLRSIAWFNPLVHLGAVYARLDQELARDAGVAARFPAARRCYAEAMLKTQLATVDLGCGWTPRTQSMLKRRIAMLAKPAPSRIRRAAGATLAVCASALVGFAAWAVQPESQPGQPASQAGAQAGQPSVQPGEQLAQAEPQDGVRGAESEQHVPLSRVPPVYPQDALDRKATGTCVMSFDLADDGDPINVSAECSDPVFATPAVEAVDRWRYASLAEDDSGLGRTGLMMMIAFELADE
jgi:beta-lactamase regulating signal transducer with metallopeptidase domain